MKFLYHFKLIFFNKKIFFRTEEENYKNVLLVELFNIKSTIISFFLFANAFSDLFKTKIIAYDTRFLTSKKKILILILNFFNFFNYFGLYRSLGVKNFIYPSKNKTRILGASLKVENENGKAVRTDKKYRKKWSVMKAEEILILRGDLDTLSIFEKNKSKRDDIADTLTQCLSYNVQILLK